MAMVMDGARAYIASGTSETGSREKGRRSRRSRGHAAERAVESRYKTFEEAKSFVLIVHSSQPVQH